MDGEIWATKNYNFQEKMLEFLVLEITCSPVHCMQEDICYLFQKAVF